jgi:transposase
MAQPLSEDLRRRVIAAVAAGMSCRAAARRFGVSAASAVRWGQRWRERGEVATRPMGGDRRSGAIEAHRQTILDAIEATPDMTLAEVRALLGQRGLTVGIGTIWRFFDRHGMSFKKNRAPRRAGAR